MNSLIAFFEKILMLGQFERRSKAKTVIKSFDLFEMRMTFYWLVDSIESKHHKTSLMSIVKILHRIEMKLLKTLNNEKIKCIAFREKLKMMIFTKLNSIVKSKFETNSLDIRVLSTTEISLTSFAFCSNTNLSKTILHTRQSDITRQYLKTMTKMSDRLSQLKVMSDRLSRIAVILSSRITYVNMKKCILKIDDEEYKRNYSMMRRSYLWS